MKLQGGSSSWLQGGQGIPLQGGSSSKLRMGKVANPQLTVGASINQTPVKKNSGNASGSGQSTNYQNTGYYGPAGAAGGGQAVLFDPQVIGQLDQSIGILQDSMKRLGNQKSIAKGNIETQYQTKYNELKTAKKDGEKQYKQSALQNSQNNRSNKNAILDQQSAGLRGLLSMLGASGAVGSDLTLAGNAVASDASMKRSGASETFARNQQGLDTNWENFLRDWGTNETKLEDWRTTQRKEAEAAALAAKQDLLTRLADFRGQKAAAMGGDYASGAAGGLSDARKLSGRIDSLGRLNPEYDGKMPAYQAATLDSYIAPAEVQTSMAGGNAAANPYLALLGIQPDERKLGY